VNWNVRGCEVGDCVNLKAIFGQRYRVCHDESFAAERRREDCPELMVLLCRYGHIFPHGSNMLGASVDGFPKVAGALRRLKCCRVHQDGDFGELTFLFDVGEFATVARIMQPRRRRRLSETQRSKLAEAGAKTRFGNGVQSELAARAREAEGPDGSRDTSAA
jgi:hypothetical protein